MTELPWHLVLHAEGVPIAPRTAARRELARTVYRIADTRGLLAFGAAEDQLHAVVVCARQQAQGVARQLAVALRSRLGVGVPLCPDQLHELRDHSHLRSVFHLVLNQRNRHGLHSDPFLDASSLPELLGARLLRTGSVELVRELLPDVGHQDLLPHLAMPRLERYPALIQPVDAVAGALALGDLHAHRELGLLGRATLVATCAPMLSTTELSWLLGLSVAGVERLRQVQVPDRLLRAVQLQLGIRHYLHLHHPTALDHTTRAPSDQPLHQREAG